MITKVYLHNFYGNKIFSRGIHLEGGAALSLYYGIERIFSNDLDFTIETAVDCQRFRDGILDPLPGNYTINHRDETKTHILDEEGSVVLTLDYFVVPPQNCYYEEVLLDGKTPSLIHSLDDILAEKLCCLIDRDAERDVLDAANIIRKLQPSEAGLSMLFSQKQAAKQSTFRTLQGLIQGLPTLATQKNNWDNQESNVQYIVDYLRELYSK